MSWIGGLGAIYFEGGNMSLEETSASAADGKFGFPYAQPYIVQLQLMQCLYKVINDRKIGIFQSPTGTGKSLSLLCGSFRWLRDHETKPITAQQSSYVATSEDKQHATIGVSGGDEPDWVLEHSRRKQEADERQKEERRRERQRQLDKRIAAIRLQESDAAKNPPAKIQVSI
jgi:chromosome transmission fidelity protein 1